MGENEMKTLADALWGYFKEKYLIPYLSDSLCYYQATVTTAPSGGMIGIQRPFDNAISIPYAWSASTLQVGDQCTVIVFGDTSNAIAVGNGTLDEPGIYVTKAGLLQSTGTATDNTMSQDAITDELALKAPLASPALTGTPTAPTAAAGTNTTQIATTAFVSTAITNAVKKYAYAFTTSNWTGAGPYTLTLNASTHGCGTEPSVEVFKKNGTSYERYYGYPSEGWTMSVNASGNITITASAAFDGKLIVR